MTNPGPNDAVESHEPPLEPSRARDEPRTFSSFLHRRMLFGVFAVVLVIGVVSLMSKSEALAVVPHLIGVRVDPQLDSLRLRLEAADLALGDVSIAPCPEFDIPGSPSNEFPAPSSTSSRRVVRTSSRLQPSK
jgi:hypothetical protein